MSNTLEIKKEHCFQVLTSKRLYCFACKGGFWKGLIEKGKSEGERNAWMEDIKNIMAKKTPEIKANVMV